MEPEVHMMEGWDPAVVLLFRFFQYGLYLVVVAAVLYTIIKYAVAAGIRLAAADLRHLARTPPRE